MTIQSVMSNKGSLILASDLAVTMEDYKSYVGVKKIFEFKDFPAGIMINGVMEFENIPLETLICEFINNYKDFESIEKLKNDFIKFISKNTHHTSINNYLTSILESFKELFQDQVEEEGFDEVIQNRFTKDIPKFVRKYTDFDNEFLDIIPDNYDKVKYNWKIWEIFSFELYFEGTGIIFAGFDTNNYYSSLSVINVYCNDDGKIIYEDVESLVNLNKPLIRVYAINEEAYSFITGVSSDFEQYIKKYIHDSNNRVVANLKWVLENEGIEDSDKILYALKSEINSCYDDLDLYIKTFRQDAIDDASQASEFVPRQLLCDFNDYLVKLTAIKQKFSLDLETVSSENDILLITKFNGPKWVKYTEKIV